MSEKITFKELIESIAEETDRSKQFTHDFLKDFVDVIHDGLEKDGKINIAGFGKFKLKRVDEREGYNPQTEEKITIPAHNKVVFKPYKDFRELINAPYAHMEPELIEKDNDSSEETIPTEEQSQQEDFIPTGPSTQHESKPAENIETDTDNENSDIVEFDADQQENNKKDKPDKFGEATESDSNNKLADKDSKQQEQKSKTEQATSESEITQQSADVDKHSTPSPTFGKHSSGRRNATSIPMGVIAAAFILFLAIGSALYFSAFSTEESPQMSATQSVQNTDKTEQQMDQQQQNQVGANKSSTNQQSTDKQNPQATQTSAAATASSSQATEKAQASENDIEPTNIQEGETLWSIAEDKYGNPRLWPWIYDKNEQLQNPNKILAGNSLSVPLPSGPQNSLNSADSVGVAKGFLATYHWYESQNSSKAKNHLWGAKLYHDNLRNIADTKINKADLKFANRAQ